MQQYEGDTGSLELLQPCEERPEITKYQALFEPDASFDRYRLAFFLNSAHNAGAGHQDWMLSALDELAETVEDGQFLRQGRDVVEARFNCFGALEYPTGYTLGAAWTTLRTSMLSPNYWFSAEEL